MAPSTKEAQRAELHKTIWRIANDLRGSVDGWDFKTFSSPSTALLLSPSAGRATDASSGGAWRAAPMATGRTAGWSNPTLAEPPSPDWS